MDYIITAEQFISNAKKYLGYKYAYAATGEVLTAKLLSDWAKVYKSPYTDSYYKRTLKNLGCPVVDCSGLCYLATNKRAERLSSSMLYELARKSGNVLSVKEAPAGSILYKKGHVGIKISQTEHIESRGVDYGVVIKDISSQPWECALMMPYIDYNNYTYPTAPVTKTSSSLDIIWLQETLNKLDNASLVVDGKYGSKTLAAHQNFIDKYRYAFS